MLASFCFLVLFMPDGNVKTLLRLKSFVSCKDFTGRNPCFVLRKITTRSIKKSFHFKKNNFISQKIKCK